MIEALACGTPVVATPQGSVPEIVTDGMTGFFGRVERGLAQAPREAGRLDRTTCRRIVADEFSITHMVRKHIRLFEPVALRRMSAAPGTFGDDMTAGRLRPTRIDQAGHTLNGVTNPGAGTRSPPPYPLWTHAPASRRTAWPVPRPGRPVRRRDAGDHDALELLVHPGAVRAGRRPRVARHDRDRPPVRLRACSRAPSRAVRTPPWRSWRRSPRRW